MPLVLVAYLILGLVILDRSYGGFVLSLLSLHILQVVLILNLLGQLIFTGVKADAIRRDLNSSGRKTPAWVNPTAIAGVLAFVALNYWLLAVLRSQLE